MAVEGIFRGECKRIFFTPTADIPCGTFVILGGIVGVTTSAVAANTQGEIQIDGDYELRYETAKAYAAGMLVLTEAYTAGGLKRVGVPVGISLETVPSGSKSIKIKLLPFYVAEHAQAFSTGAAYDVGDVVIYSSKFYVCKTAVTTPGNWSASNWTELSAAASAIGAFA